MAEAGVAEVTIIPVSPGAQNAIADALGGSRAGDRVGNDTGRSLVSRLGSVVRGVGIGVMAGAGLAIGSALSRGFSRLQNIDQATASLRGLGHSAEGVQTIMDSALASVRGTAFGMGDAAQVAANAVAAGVQPGEALTRTLKLTADAASIAGVSMGEMGGIFNKVAAADMVQMDVINQLHDAGVPALALLADQMGVTNAEARKLASDGKINFETFQAAMEAGLGGAALESGTTFSGAMANVGASLGRIGAGLLGGVFPKIAPLFQALLHALAPVEEAAKGAGAALGDALAPALDAVTRWLNETDFTLILTGLRGLFDLVVGGNFSGALRDAFGWEEDSGLVVFVLNVRDAISGLFDLVVNGNFSGKLREVFGWEEDSGFVTFVLDVRAAVADFFSTVTSGGDVSGTFDKIFKSLGSLAPAFAAFGQQLPAISTSTATLAAGALPALSDVLAFLATHVQTIIAWMPAIVAGFVAWKVASTASALSTHGLLAAQTAMLPVSLANNVARTLASTAELRYATATGASTAATNMSLAAHLRAGAAFVASKVAMAAHAVVTGISTAAQWALNAALTANPIGIVIALIVALVAGLIWFFTQTQLGQDIWANFTRFLGEAWTNTVNFVIAAGAALASWWNGLWAGISAWAMSVWNGIVSFVTGYARALATIIVAVIRGLQAAWNATWSAIQNFVAAVWNRIVSVVTTVVNAVRSVIAAVLNGISAVWSGGWNGIVSFIGAAWGRIVTGVSTGIGNVLTFVSGIPGRVISALGNLGSLLLGAGKSLIQGFINGISSMIGAVGNAVGGIMDFVGGFFPHSPAKRGPFSGAGWRRVSGAGEALIEQFTAGMGGSVALDVATGAVSAAVGRVNPARYAAAAVPASPRFEEMSIGGSDGDSDRPIYMDGSIIGVLRQVAGEEARIILNDNAARVGAGVKGRFAP